MNNSPPTPAGTPRNDRSSTRKTVFAIGAPIGTTPPPGRGHDHHDTSTDASVGPYKFSTVAVACREKNAPTSSPDNPSPPQATSRRAGIGAGHESPTN